MSNPVNPNLAGAVDLGALMAAKQAKAESEAAKANAPAGAIMDVTEATFEQDVVQKSKSVPVVVDFWATWCAPCRQLSPILEKLTAEFGGRIALAKIDSDANQQVAAAFQVQSIPSVYLVINGQVQPLFQGAQPEPQVRQIFEQILKVAEQMGLAAPASGTEETELESAPAALDPRLEPAYNAIENQQWQLAREEFEALLQKNPADEEARAGLVQVGIIERTFNQDLDAILQAEITNLADRILHADAAFLMGDLATAFDTLISAIPASEADDKKTLQQHVLDYFLLLGDIEQVRIARRKLTNALF